MSIDSLLQPFHHFGVNLGLERIKNLLANLGNPHHQVPIIHVAGTNGKGSVCAYLSSVLTAAGYRVGRYISPHLVSWSERICINDNPIPLAELESLILQVKSAIDLDSESPTQFEVITAAAWLYFAQQKVDIAVIEVGLGGRLDATNVCDRPLVSIITSISREHWQVLGPTLADIAGEKAGILKPHCPAVIGQLPSEAMAVVKRRIEELNCPAVFPEAAKELKTAETQRTQRKEEKRWVEYEGIEFPLGLLGDFQLQNSALAIATLQFLQKQGWEISSEAIVSGMGNAQWPGRLQWVNWQGHRILIDGAHNPAAAIALRHYINSLNPPSVTWIIGMLSTKDHADVFQALLQPNDQLHLVPVPDYFSANLEDLATLAQQLCPQLSLIQTYPNLTSALEVAVPTNQGLTVLCGSLYLLGYFFQISQKSL
ncbi:bifunctional folylpolyglutamate synthase/dihydrofolate synthase [[Phormidium ambiguum] IAM M-71]|uniref:Dihydrofolate synthase/folylpolyglutamate synthase n=1 Tax=[Phormidium ambiguum] IAM M-71 TaxID=454136 RepID=A0A1U7IKC3_9CYAN|nr:folylpolyglutamate synthase/dihydrofolate synthase family protein [Phormidium ambiguum]OKH37683.1 bifunctional folylpolyglutamate synthase/dihydrofolate synthase [Phormidium ambiguum IAM M-71]